MANSPFQLLYDIRVQGIDALDNVSKKNAQISLDTKYSEAAFSKLEAQLNRLVISGESYRSALEKVSASQRKFGAESAEFARDMLRNDEARRRSINENIRAKQKEAEAAERSERSILAASKSASVLAGVHDSRALDSLLGRSLSGPMAIGAVAATATASFGMGIVRDAAKNAEELHRVSEELGITTTQASRLEMAARLSGDSLGTMTQAAQRLGAALEDPAGAGKKAAEELTRLGVSLQQGLGPAFEEALDKLGKMQDPAERAAAGLALFGRQWQRYLDISKNQASVGPGIDENLNKQLLEAEKTLGDFDNKWTILKAKLAAGVILPVAIKVSTTVDTMAQSGQLFSALVESAFDGSLFSGKAPAKTVTKNGTEYTLTPDGKLIPTKQARAKASVGPLDFSRADAALRGGPLDKVSLDEQIQAKKAEYEKADALLKNDRATAKAGEGVQQRLNTEAANVIKLRSEYEKLEAAKKAASRDPNAVGDIISRYRGQVDIRESDKDPLTMAREQMETVLREARKEHAGPKDINRILSVGVTAQLQARREIANQQRDFFAKMDAVASAQDIKDAANLTSGAFSGTNKAMQAVLYPNFNAQTITAARFKAEQDAKDRQFQQLNLQFQSGTMERQFGQLSNQRRAAGSDTPNQTYQDRMQLATRLYDLQTKQASLEEDADRRALEMQRAKYEYITAQDEARIERENKIAEINERQREETRSFTSGLFNAAISGQPNATSNFFREFGRRQVDQIIGNIGENTLGTLESKLTLQHDPTKAGILGTGEKPNWLGQALKGTFFGFDPANDKASVTSSFTPLITETGRNTAATEQNTQAILQLGQGFVGGSAGSGTGAIPSPNLPTAAERGGVTMPSLPNLATIGSDVSQAVSKIPSAFESLGRIIGGPGGTSGFAGPLGKSQNLDRLPINLDFQGNSGILGNAHTDVEAKAPPAINLSSEYAPDDVIQSLSDSLSRVPMAVPPFTGGPASSGSSSGMDDVLASMRRGDITRSEQIQQKQQDPELTTATGIASKLSQLMGGAKYTESGRGLGGVLTGGMDLGNGQGVALSGTQRLGLGLGIGAQAAGGAYEAVQGFSKGGARGDVQGIAGTLAAAAPFAGPAAPFLEAGAAITGLISSLFPDPRQERIRAMQKNLENSAYLTPAARDYNYASGGGGGFSSSEGGGIRAGGQTANYSLNISAMDPQSVLNHAKQNPETWSQLMEVGFTSGSAQSVASLVSWQSQNGGNIPSSWSQGGR